MEELVLVGGGGHCKSVIDVIESGGKYKIAGIIDMPEKLGGNLLGYSYFATDEDLGRLAREYRNFHITIGQIRISDKRLNIYSLLIGLGATLPVIVSPTAYVSKHATIKQGTVIMHGVVVNASAVVGENCIINTNALIEHDAWIEEHSHVATGAIINGGVHVGKGCFVGSGAVTKQYVTLPDNSFIKANTIFIG